MRTAYHSKQKLAFWLGLIAIILATVIWQVRLLDTFTLSSDEGIHLMVAQLVIAGYRPYSEVFFSQMPLFWESVRLPLQWLGSVTAVRSVTFVFALLGIGGVALLGREMGNSVAGLAAAIFLALSQNFTKYAWAVLPDMPALVLGLWAFWAAVRYAAPCQARDAAPCQARDAAPCQARDAAVKQRWWLVISGVLLALSFLFKLTTVYVLGLVLWFIWLARWQNSPANLSWREKVRSVIKDTLILGVSLVLPFLGILIWYHLPSLISSAVEMRLAMRDAFDKGIMYNVSRVVEFWREGIPLTFLAIYGLVWLYRQGKFFGSILVWLGLVTIELLNHVPLYGQHLQLFLPILVIMAGMGVVGLIDSLRSAYADKSFKRWLWSGVGLVLLAWCAGFLWQTRSQLTLPIEPEDAPLTENDRVLVEYLQRFTSPDDCLVTDKLVLAFLAERLVPPQLAEVSSARLQSGYLTYDELVSATETYGCQVIAPVNKRLKRTHSDFIEWGKGRFLGLWLLDDSEVLVAQPFELSLRAKPLVTPQPTHSLSVTLAQQVELMGFDWTQDADALYVSLYWQAMQPFADDYSVFVHLRDSANTVLVNGDHEPYDGLAPTSRWPVGQTVKETIRLDLPPDLSAGEYQLLVGLYSPHTLERLPVDNDVSGENAAIMPKILIQ